VQDNRLQTPYTWLILFPVFLTMQNSKPCLLIVDDDLPTLELYQRELSGEYRVLTCQDRLEAEKLLQTPGLSAVILEPTISGGEGWKLLKELGSRWMGSRRMFPIILCSSSDERKRGMEEGAQAFLIKPVLPADLHLTLRRVMAFHPG
jgi:DNA-binding response OmpR family regulator